MPKLPKDAAKRVNETEGGSFKPIPAGLYGCTLLSVAAADKSGKPFEGPKGPYWRWECVGFEREANNKHFFDNTSLSPEADWKMKQVFDAFSVPSDTDTEELLGKKVLLRITIGTIQSGARAGDDTNQVGEWLPYVDDDDNSAEDF